MMIPAIASATLASSRDHSGGFSAYNMIAPLSCGTIGSAIAYAIG